MINLGIRHFPLLRNQEALEKYQKWVETEPCTQLRSRNKMLVLVVKKYAKTEQSSMQKSIF